jgi:predicted phage terminase large subunit-like protein
MATKTQGARETKLKSPTLQKKVAALTDFWEFVDLINYQGGSARFAKCHRDLWDWYWKSRYDGVEKHLTLMPRGHLKAQSLNSMVPTVSGLRRFGDLKVGDKITGSFGSDVTITHTHPISKMDLYRVFTADGRSTLCNLEHLWRVQIPSNSKKWVIKSTKELLDCYKTPRYDKRYPGKLYSENRVRIEPIPFKGIHDDTLAIDPYTLGVWLGDGTSADSGFTCHDNDRAIMERIGCYKNNTRMRWTLKGLMTNTKKLGIWNAKRIPENYFQASYTQRLELLRGLMDTDGTCSLAGLPSFSNANPHLIDDVLRLVRSLGGKGHVCSYSSSYPDSDKKFPTQTINICVKDNPFWLARKAQRWRRPKKIELVISDIQYEKSDLGRCITVDAEDGIYLTDNYLPTHNSTIMSVGRCLWRIYQNPNIRIYVGTSKGELSTAFVREMKSYLEADWLQDNVWNARPHIKGTLIPVMDTLGRSRRQKFEEDGEYTEAKDKKVIWRSNALQVNREYILKEPTLMVGSVGAQATGMHFDEAQFDDIVTFDNISTPDKLERLMGWVYDIQSVIDPPYLDDWLLDKLMKVGIPQAQAEVIASTGGTFNVVGTRYDLEDYYGHIIENSDDLGFRVYQKNIYNNDVDNTDGYLWSEKWNEKLEDQTRKSMTTRRFASQYLNQIVDTASTLLRWDEVRMMPLAGWGKKEGMPGCIWFKPAGSKSEKIIRLHMMVDPAAAVHERSDFTCVVVGGKDIEGNFYLVDAQMGRWKASQIVRAIYEAADKWGLRSVNVEMIGGFKHFKDYLQQSFSEYRPLSIFEFKPQGDKESRVLNAIEPLINNGMFYTTIYLKGAKQLQDQMMFFPRKNMHDDFPDATAALIEISKRPVANKTPKAYEANKRWGGIR